MSNAQALDMNPDLSPGVLNSNQLRALQADDVIISASKIDAKGSAFDLHLGNAGWCLQGSIKQLDGDSDKETVKQVCQRYGKPFRLSQSGAVLKKGTVAVVKLKESIDFSQHPWLNGEATGKSSIGRLDILTRLLVDGCPEYERVPGMYVGPLYVEIAPISFDIKIYPDDSLNQLRIHCGFRTPMSSLVGRRLLFKSQSEFCSKAQDNGTLSLDTSNRGDDQQFAAYVLRKGPLNVVDFKKKGKIGPSGYFEKVRSRKGAITIDVDRFYILRSIERLCLPNDVAVTGMAYSENLGELRIHYAGFAHPWFGYERGDDKVGTPLIFEVRAHNFPIVLRHSEVFATIRFYKMAASSPKSDKESGSDSYSNQELKLSNFFSAK